MPSPPRQTDQFSAWPELIFPNALPVSERRDELAEAIRKHPIVIVCGETGSGKTTQLPKICALAGRGRHGLIGHTQPRRLAATTVARRIAEELGTPLGAHVGYKIRFQESFAKGARIKLMTDGILLAETQTDPLLRAYDTLIIDEAHERSLNIDFLLGYLKRLLLGARRKDLRVVITSATIDAGRLAEHFTLPDSGPAPVFEISGRTYPVEIRYQPAPEGEELELAEQIEVVIEELWREAEGDVLVFLPGEREIRDVADHLRAAVARAANAGQRSGMGRVLGVAPVEILPLFARLSVADQQRVFAGASGRRVVLATNVAETSLTVPGIRYVIDSGMARVKRYRFRNKLEQLQIEAVSQASANQRAGRCGRVMHGICIRLYSEDDFNTRPRFGDPEILRVSLAGVLLRMKALKLGAINDFPFLDPPQAKAVADGLASLFEIGAIDEQGGLTALGKRLAQLPLDPRIARMLLAGHEFHCLQDVLIIASALSVQDPRERPMDQQQAADEQHRRFHDERSDFLGWIKLWNYVFPKEAILSRRNRERQLQREFINARRLREWSDVYQQLEQSLADLHLNPKSFQGSEDARFAAIHQALMTGLLGNLGFCSGESNQYSGTHDTRFFIHPGSALQRKTPRWIMAAEVVDTSRVYARTVARVEPAWIERIGGHLLRRSWSEPHWEKKAAQVVAFERATIYGLILYAQRRVHYAHREPVMAREILIREALVNLDWDSHLPFMQHNRRLVHEAQQLEQKMRRPDVLADQTMLYAWFDQRLPADVATGQRLEQWWRSASQQDPECLCLPREALLRKQIDGLEDERFPRLWRSRGLSLDLAYRFEPGASDDGVTLVIPLAALSQVDERQCEWLVPGLLEEKVLALMKSLPQRLRRNLVPLQAWVDRFMIRRQRDEPSSIMRRSLIEVLIEQAREDGGAMISVHDFRLEQLPRHLQMHFRLIDEHAAVLGMSRSLAELKSRFSVRGQNALQAAFQGLALREPLMKSNKREAPGQGGVEAAQVAHMRADRGAPTYRFDASQRFQHWAFGSLPELMEIERDGQALIGFPALLDHGDDVGLQVFDDLDAAQLAHEDGLMRLLAIHFREPLRFFLKQLPDGQRIEVLYSQWGSAKALHQDLCFALLQRACLGVDRPRCAESFEALCRSARPRLGLVGQELSRLLLNILSEYTQLMKRLTQAKSGHAQADIEQQLTFLLPKDFLKQTPPDQLGHLPRYLQAIHQRLDRLRVDPQRDRELMSQLLIVEAPWRKLLLARRGRSDEKLSQFAWMLQELRVSLFAQTLKTPMPVSVKRLERWWQANAIR
jgi:ATP-dependent helicase HrpA